MAKSQSIIEEVGGIETSTQAILGTAGAGNYGVRLLAQISEPDKVCRLTLVTVDAHGVIITALPVNSEDVESIAVLFTNAQRQIAQLKERGVCVHERYY